jgi:hypothetical protein
MRKTIKAHHILCGFETWYYGRFAVCADEDVWIEEKVNVRQMEENGREELHNL